MRRVDDPVLDDLVAQQAELAGLLASLDDDGWARPSRCAGWSIADVVLHIAQTNEMAIASCDGRFDDQTGTPLTGLFLIDRKQTVLMNPRNGFPAPVADPAQAVASLIKGEWPSEQATEAQDR